MLKKYLKFENKNKNAKKRDIKATCVLVLVKLYNTFRNSKN